MDLLHATIEEFAAEGYTHIERHCSRCRIAEAPQHNHINEMHSA